MLLLIDKDIEALVDVLLAANKGFDRRVTQALLDSFIDDSETDVDSIFEEVLGFLSRANATKKKTLELIEEAEKALAAQNQN